MAQRLPRRPLVRPAWILLLLLVVLVAGDLAELGQVGDGGPAWIWLRLMSNR